MFRQGEVPNIWPILAANFGPRPIELTNVWPGVVLRHCNDRLTPALSPKIRVPQVVCSAVPLGSTPKWPMALHGASFPSGTPEGIFEDTGKEQAHPRIGTVRGGNRHQLRIRVSPSRTRRGSWECSDCCRDPWVWSLGWRTASPTNHRAVAKALRQSGRKVFQGVRGQCLTPSNLRSRDQSVPRGQCWIRADSLDVRGRKQSARTPKILASGMTTRTGNDFWDEFKTTGKIRGFISRFRAKDGRIFWGESSADPIEIEGRACVSVGDAGCNRAAGLPKRPMNCLP